MFANINKALVGSMDFLYHNVNLLYHDPLVYEQYSMGYNKVAMMQSIEIMAKSKKCIHCFHLALDSNNPRMFPVTMKPSCSLVNPGRM